MRYTAALARVAAAAALFGMSSPARAQEGDPPPEAIVSRALAATVDYGNDAVFQPAKHDTTLDRLGLDPQQTVNVTVQFPVEMAGQSILAEALDGGVVTLPDGGLIVADDGTVSFQFQASDASGCCRLAVHQPDDSNFLLFWVIDPDHLENTPPDLPGAY